MLEQIDQNAAKWAANHVEPDHVPALRRLTHLGGTEVAVAAGVVAAIVGSFRSRSVRPALRLLAVIGGQNLIHNAIKLITRRSRPEGPHHSHFAGHSFPSGHTATAAATWPAVITTVAPQAGVPLQAAGYVAGPAVGATRVLLGVHWLSDVVAGLALGWGWLALVNRVGKRITGCVSAARST